jgi:predicted phage terminase large subunit-like protein
MLFLPPRHGKSELASKRFPAWFLGRNPNKQMIAASYNSDLAGDFGRDVRNIVGSDEYGKLFEVGLAPDSQAANRWHTDAGGSYVAAGVGTAITGRGADVLLIDDPLKDRSEADSETVRDNVWNWYTSTAYTRLMPGGAIVLIQCMTGDTRVLMANGEEKLLRDVAVGDMVASYENGKIVSSRVANWANKGPDNCFTIKTSSGITVTANERHPFLVDRNGEREWVRLQNLSAGDNLVSVIGENGEAWSVKPRVASCPQSARGSVARTTTNGAGRAAFALLQSIRFRVERLTCAIGTALAWPNMRPCFSSKAATARCASGRPGETSEPIGVGSCASIIATTLARFVGCSATTAISPSGTVERQRFCLQPLSTFVTTLDAIVSIEPHGREDVFDIQVDRTENFIANGVVSHNTRWHEDDLAGRLLESDAERWEVVSMPALGRDGAALWPQWYDAERLAQIRSVIGTRDWNALYQQDPMPDGGAYFQRDWIHYYDELPKHCTFYGASDYAVTEGDNDWTVHGTAALDPDHNLYLVDLWREQATSDVWVESVIDLMAMRDPLEWAEEAGQIIKGVGPFLARRMDERGVYCYRKQYTSARDKPTRARAIQARMSMGKVFLPRNAPWLAEFERELLRFPSGKHDDQVDVLSLFGRILDSMVAGSVPKAAEPTRWGHQRTFDEMVRRQRAKRLMEA